MQGTRVPSLVGEQRFHLLLEVAKSFFKTIFKKMYIHIVKYYSALKNNEIMPLAATWMEPEISILRKLGRERQTLCDITCMCHLKNETNELIYKIEVDSQT